MNGPFRGEAAVGASCVDWVLSGQIPTCTCFLYIRPESSKEHRDGCPLDIWRQGVSSGVSKGSGKLSGGDAYHVVSDVGGVATWKLSPVPVRSFMTQ